MERDDRGKNSAKDVRKSLIEMAIVYRMPLWERVRYIYLPSLTGRLK